MASLNELNNNITELKSIIKGIVPGTASGDLAKFVLTAGADGATAKFSLPSRVAWVGFCSEKVPVYGFPASAASFEAFKLTTTAGVVQEFKQAGPLDLSSLHIFALAASSGATLVAWVQKAAGL